MCCGTIHRYTQSESMIIDTQKKREGEANTRTNVPLIYSSLLRIKYITKKLSTILFFCVMLQQIIHTRDRNKSIVSSISYNLRFIFSFCSRRASSSCFSSLLKSTKATSDVKVNLSKMRTYFPRSLRGFA